MTDKFTQIAGVMQAANSLVQGLTARVVGGPGTPQGPIDAPQQYGVALGHSPSAFGPFEQEYATKLAADINEALEPLKIRLQKEALAEVEQIHATQP